LYLQIMKFEMSLSPEDGNHHLHLHLIRIDLLDKSGKVIEGTVRHFYSITGLEWYLWLLTGFTGLVDLAHDPVDLIGPKRRRLITRGQKTDNRRHTRDGMLHISIQDGMNEDIPGEDRLLTRAFFTATHLKASFCRNNNVV